MLPRESGFQDRRPYFTNRVRIARDSRGIRSRRTGGKRLATRESVAEKTELGQFARRLEVAILRAHITSFGGNPRGA